ncbi:unnamed protein product, partial [Durusdinium trenchii]
TSSDLWSAGCILYEMYKRQPLFARDLPRRVKTLESLFGRPEGVKTLESWLAEWRSMEAKR